jgi:uncharacterized membrane protein (DUF4010 family)
MAGAVHHRFGITAPIALLLILSAAGRAEEAIVGQWAVSSIVKVTLALKKNLGQKSRRDLKPRLTVLAKARSSLTYRPTVQSPSLESD